MNEDNENINFIEFNITAGGKISVTVFQFPPFRTADEGESVTLNCALDFEGNVTLIGTAHWTRGKPDGYKLDKSPFYEGRLEKSGSDSFTNNRIFINISDLIEKDTDTYYCRVSLMETGVRDGNGTKLEVRRRIRGEKSRDINLLLLLGGALTLLGMTIMILTCRLIWQNKVILRLKRNHSGTNAMYATINPQPTSQVYSNRGSDEAVSQQYAKVNKKQGAKTSTVEYETHHAEYATIK
ncbi:natural cytotoxicity triggering receptor 3-like isoform X2 [Heterodontus francisci]|uniref:natural cytotoxicity triggering receptor 3-like isoform X2 n=1 Tax=Heterodontus francisci TaxID=7792 RepID=UPI00355B3198